MKLFDPQCYTLASYFLDDCEKVTEAERKDLAYTVQQAIEEWLEDLDSVREEARQCAYEAHIDAQIDERRIEGKQEAYDRD